MPEGFRSLAELLREEQPASSLPEDIEADAEDSNAASGEIAAARDVRLFHARLADAFESAIADLRRDIAAEILGRELELAPAAIAEIVRRALERCRDERVLRVRVHPDDACSLAGKELETLGDSALRRGDAVLEVTGGTIDFSLGVRLDAVLRT